MMAALMAFVAIAGILSTVAFQQYAELLRRDNEAEMMFRSQEIVRAIQRYRADHAGIAPLELELLMEPGPKGNYYLRRMYTDPLVADGKWGLLFVGPGNQIIDPNSEQQGELAGQAQGLGRLNEGQRGGLAGKKNDSGGSGFGSGGNGAGNGAGNDPNAKNSLGAKSRSGFGNSSGGATQATGLPIAGVRTLSDDRPFRVYNGLTDYSQWLFTYFDLETQQPPGGNGNRRNGAGNPPGGNPTGGNPAPEPPPGSKN